MKTKMIKLKDIVKKINNIEKKNEIELNEFLDELKEGETNAYKEFLDEWSFGRFRQKVACESLKIFFKRRSKIQNEIDINEIIDIYFGLVDACYQKTLMDGDNREIMWNDKIKKNKNYEKYLKRVENYLEHTKTHDIQKSYILAEILNNDYGVDLIAECENRKEK